MEHNSSIAVFGIVSVFIVAFVFYLLSVFLNLLFRNRNVKKEEEINKVVEESKTKEDDLLDDTELAAAITASISAYSGMSSDKFIIKSIKEYKTPIWGMIDRLPNKYK